jgi:hypothetical protein
MSVNPDLSKTRPCKKRKSGVLLAQLSDNEFAVDYVDLDGESVS